MGFDQVNGTPEKAVQWYHASNFRFDPFYHRALTPGARELFSYLNYRAWETKDLVVRAAASFLARNSGIGARSVERHLGLLMRIGLIHPDLRANSGNRYIVEPFLIGETAWTVRGIRHLELSHLVRFRQNGGTRIAEIWAEIDGYRQNGGTVPPKWRSLSKMLSTESRQIGGQYYFFYSLLLVDALRHGPRTNPGPCSKGKEGVGLTADAYEKRRQEQLSLLREGVGLTADTILNVASVQAQIEKVEKKKKPVSGVGESNFHASSDFDGSSL